MGPADIWGTPSCKVGAEDTVERRVDTSLWCQRPVQCRGGCRPDTHPEGTVFEGAEGDLEGKASRGRQNRLTHSCNLYWQPSGQVLGHCPSSVWRAA